MKRYFILFAVLVTLPLTAFADSLNSTCQALWGTLKGSHSATMEYVNGATQNLSLTFSPNTVLGFKLSLNGTSQQTDVQLVNGAISGRDTCLIAGAHVTLTELAVPNMFEANFNGVYGVLTLDN